MYFDTNIEYDNQVMNEFIEKEMHRVRKEAFEKLSPVFAHLKYIDEFAMTLSYSWFDSQDYAEKIANDFDLGKLDFLSIQEKFDTFKKEYLKDYEPALNF
jgi:hypothetical protein